MEQCQTQKRFFISAILIFCLTFGPAFTAYAAGPTAWDGSDNSHWEDGNNWTNGVPGPGQISLIANSGAPNQANISAAGAEAGTLTIGNFGMNGSLHISGTPATLDTTTTYIGSGAGGGIGTVSMESGSIWTNTGEFYVGHDSGNGDLTVKSGAVLNNADHFFVGDSSGTGTVTIMDPSSVLSLSRDLFIGVNGTGQMTVSGGGTLDAGDGRSASIGDDLGNGTLTVTDVGSTLLGKDTNFVVGDDGGTGSMYVTLGASAEIGGIILGNAGGSTGSLNIDGSSQLLDYQSTIIGEKGSGSVLVDHSSVFITMNEGRIGNANGGEGIVTLQRGGSWSVQRKLFVGAANSATGAAYLNEGVLTTDGDAFIGFDGGTGILAMENLSTYTSNSALFIGHSGVGEVFALSGSTISIKDALYIGTVDPASAGHLTVSGGGSQVTVDKQTFIADGGGTGTVDILDGGIFNSLADVYVGNNSGQATINVDGSGSSWIVSGALEGALYLGASAALNVTNSGYVQVAGNANFYGDDGAANVSLTTGGYFDLGGSLTLGSGSHVSYSLAVKDTGSTLQTGGDFYAGSNGATGNIEVSSGGSVNVGGSANFADGLNSSMNLTVTGSGSLLNTGSAFTFAGNDATGNILVSNGGAIQTMTDAVIGYNGGAATATVTGVGSTWANGAGRMNIGEGAGGDGTLNVINRGEVTAGGQFNIGFGAGATGFVTIDGAGSLLSVSGSLALGRGNGTGTMTISDQSVVTAAAFNIGVTGGSGTLNIGAALGDTADVAGILNATTVAGGTGTGQIVFNHTNSDYNFSANITGAVEVIHAGGETYLTGTASNYSLDTFVMDGVFGADGGDVTSSTLYIATANGEEALMEIKGGSTWSAGGNRIFVGTDGGLGSLIVSEGSSLTGAGRIGLNGGLGDVTVTGAGTTWDHTGHFRLGYDDGGGAGAAAMIISDGAYVSSSIGINTVGYGTGSIGEVFVRGAGSTWDIDDELRIGEAGGTGYITIEDGGYVSSSLTKIGIGSGSNAYALVTGVGSQWDMSGDFYLGTAFDDANFIVEQGAIVNTAGDAYVGDGATATALVTDAGSEWNIGQDLFVGINVGDGTLDIENGALVTVGGDFVIGEGIGSTAAVTITGGNTVFLGSSFTYVANQGATASLTISDGAEASMAALGVGLNNGGTGSFILSNTATLQTALAVIGADANGSALITGAGTVWSNTTDFGIGVATVTASQGELTIADGAVLNNGASVTIGAEINAVGSILVTGAGSELNAAGNLLIGTTGGEGVLVIDDSAEVTADTLTAGYDGGQGSVQVTGSGSKLTIAGISLIGTDSSTAEGALLVTNGGEVVFNDDLIIGQGGTGEVTVTGVNSIIVAGTVYLASMSNGVGTLNVLNGGTFSASGIVLGDNSGGPPDPVATINIGGGGAAGDFDVGQLEGIGVINFNHTDTAYNFRTDFNNADILINHYSGTTIATGTAVTAQDLVIHGGKFIIDGDYDVISTIVDSAGLLGGTGIVRSDVLNDGVVSPGEITTPGTLTINGDYIGNNGSLLINTVLGLDASATDKLVITGTASGTTTVFVTNRGGLGGVTTGDGIKIIETGSVNGGVFTLNGGQVAAGGYIYNMYQGGLDPLNNPNDFFLRSGGVRPEIPAYVPAPATSVFYVNQSIGTLADRVDLGQNFLNKQSFALNMDNDGGLASLAAAEGVWVRAFGGHRRFESGDANNSSFSGSFGGMQVGKDIWREEYNDGSKNNIGIFASRGYGKGDLSSNLGDAGDTSFTSTALGAYWTHYMPNDTYFNSTLQYTRINGMKINPIGGAGIETAGNSYAASIEAGKPIKMSRHSNTTIEPQAQITYQYISFEDANDGVATVAFDAVNSVTGRVGFRASHTSQTKGGLGLQPWARFNIAHTLSDDSVLTLAGTDTFRTSLSGTTGEIETGFTVGKADPNGVGWGIYTTLGYQFSLSGPKTSGWMGSLGLRFNW